MTAKQRQLIISLLNKTEKNPEIAKDIGIEIEFKRVDKLQKLEKFKKRI